MKKIFKKVVMLICSLALIINILGAKVSEVNAATTYVTFTYTVDVSLTSSLENGGPYQIYLENSNGSSVLLGTATKKTGFGNFKLYGSNKLRIAKGQSQKVRIVVCGTNTYTKKPVKCPTASYRTVSSDGKFSKTFKVTGSADKPKLN